MIRELLITDLPALAELYFQFWEEESDISQMEKQFEIIKKDNRHILLVYEENGKVIGTVMGVVCRELYGTCRPFLVVENFIVDKNHRRKGIGKLLMNELERKARERNCTQMILVTEKDRADACGFYLSYGFQTNNAGYKKKL